MRNCSRCSGHLYQDWRYSAWFNGDWHCTCPCCELPVSPLHSPQPSQPIVSSSPSVSWWCWTVFIATFGDLWSSIAFLQAGCRSLRQASTVKTLEKLIDIYEDCLENGMMLMYCSWRFVIQKLGCQAQHALTRSFSPRH